MSKQVHVIDPNCDYRDGQVYNDYDCTLNQTDIRTNANKFYIMQVIEKNGMYYHFIRYGRVGEKGRISHASYSNGASAGGAFVKQYKSKTGNTWGVSPFIPKKGKYTLCEMDYTDVFVPTKEPGKTGVVVCNLEPVIQDFLRLVSDVKEMNKTMIDLDIDTKKMPLGKLSQSQIDKGYAILNKIQIELKKQPQTTQATSDDIVDLSSCYYTLIPYSCGRGRSPPIINTVEIIQKYTETLDELSNITVAAKIIKDSTIVGDHHPLDIVYKEINTDIKAVERNSKIWNMIRDYVYNTHAPTHSNYNVELLEIYDIQRTAERDTYLQNFGNYENRQLLWHGTRLTNYISILKNGLLLRPDVIPGTYISGKMFGYGIYAANSFSKSFNYTGANKSNPVACLFLGEFALGKTSNRTTSDYYISKESLKQLGCNSTWGRGKTTPVGFETMDDGVIVPNGKLGSSNISGASLLYDEFIVYDQNQLNLRYIIKVRGNFQY